MSATLQAWLAIWATALIGAFVSGAFAYLSTPHPGIDWKHVVIGALVAGGAAAWHRYQQPPTDPPTDPNGGAPGASAAATSTDVLPAALLALALLLSGCAEFWADLAKVGQGAQWIESIVAAAEPEIAAYFALQPDPDAQAKVAVALTKTKQAIAALNEAIATATDAHDGNVAAAEADAIAAYRDLAALVDSLPSLPITQPAIAGELKPHAPPKLPPADRVAAVMEVK